MLLSDRDRALLINLFGSGRIHVGRLPVPALVAAVLLCVAKKKRRKKMALNSALVPSQVGAYNLVYDGSGTDWQSILTNVFDYASPAAAGLLFLSIVGAFSTAPGPVSLRLQRSGVTLALFQPVAWPGSLDAAVSVLEQIQNIAGSGSYTIEMVAANACTFSLPAAAVNARFVWAD